MDKELIVFDKEYIIHKQYIHMIDDIISDVIIECGLKSFHSFNKQHRLNDLILSNIKNNKTENIKIKNERKGKLCLILEI